MDLTQNHDFKDRGFALGSKKTWEACLKGAWLIVVGGLIGAVISAYYYLAPGIGLDGEGGVMLVIVSSLLMAAAGLAVAGRVTGFWATVLATLILLDIIGTAVCAYFLETPILLAAMALALIGWLMRAIGHAADNSVEVA